MHSPGPTGETEVLLERANQLAGTRRGARAHPRPGQLAPPGQGPRARRARAGGQRAPVGLHCQGAGGVALAAVIESVRAGAEWIACALYPVALSFHRVSAEALAQALAGLGHDAGVDLCSGGARSLRGRGAGRRAGAAVFAARRRARRGVQPSRRSRRGARRQAARARLRRPARRGPREELTTIRRECGWPLASPIGQVLGSQALLHILLRLCWRFVVDELRDLVEGRYGSPPAEVDPTVSRAVELLGDGVPILDNGPKALDELREDAEGLASSEEELPLLALYDEDAEPLLRAVRGRGPPRRVRHGRADAQRGRLAPRDHPRRPGVGHRRGDDRGGGDARHRAALGRARRRAPRERRRAHRARARGAGRRDRAACLRRDQNRVSDGRHFHQAPEPGAAPFVEEETPSSPVRRSASSRR